MGGGHSGGRQTGKKTFNLHLWSMRVIKKPTHDKRRGKGRSAARSSLLTDADAGNAAATRKALIYRGSRRGLVKNVTCQDEG